MLVTNSHCMTARDVQVLASPIRLVSLAGWCQAKPLARNYRHPIAMKSGTSQPARPDLRLTRRPKQHPAPPPTPAWKTVGSSTCGSCGSVAANTRYAPAMRNDFTHLTREVGGRGERPGSPSSFGYGMGVRCNRR